MPITLKNALELNPFITKILLKGNRPYEDDWNAGYDDFFIITTQHGDNVHLDPITKGRTKGRESLSELVEALKVCVSITEVCIVDFHTILDWNLDCIERYNDHDGSIIYTKLADAFKENSSPIRKICIQNGCRDDYGCTNNKVIPLAKAFQVMPSLTHLNLCNNDINGTGAKALAEAFKVNTTIKEIELKCNNIGDMGAYYLAEAFEVNSTITHVDLNNNKIKDDGASALADAFSVNSTITHVELNNNEIGYDGASALAYAFTVNTTIKEIELKANCIRCQGALELAAAFKRNSTIKEIQLIDNPVFEEGLLAFAEAIKVNSAIEKLSIGNLIGYKFNNTWAILFLNALKSNIKLNHLIMPPGKSDVKHEEFIHALVETVKVNITICNYSNGSSVGIEGIEGMEHQLGLNSRIEDYGQSFLTYRYLHSILSVPLARSGDVDDTLVGKTKKRKIDAEKAKDKGKNTSTIPPECVLLIAEYLGWESISSKKAVPIILKNLPLLTCHSLSSELTDLSYFMSKDKNFECQRKVENFCLKLLTEKFCQVENLEEKMKYQDSLMIYLKSLKYQTS